MKNAWKSRHLLFWVHRVYGIQNDRINLTVNEFSTVLKTLHVKRLCYTFSSKNEGCQSCQNSVHDNLVWKVNMSNTSTRYVHLKLKIARVVTAMKTLKSGVSLLNGWLSAHTCTHKPARGVFACGLDETSAGMFMPHEVAFVHKSLWNSFWFFFANLWA